MLRVTPIYGSRFSAFGEAEEPSCTLIEFSDCRCLINVGWIDETDESTTFPEHDCVLLTDSTLQSVRYLRCHCTNRRVCRMEKVLN
jgi:Cft2 family RNA processing exonuclease